MAFTRFAPSPTGYLHRGHLLSALFVFAAAKHFGLKVLLRIEDHDKERSKKEYIESIPKDLERFGFSFDAFSLQSNHEQIFQNYAKLLEDKKLIYPCFCTRKTLFEENLLNHEGELIYNGKCRLHPILNQSEYALRFKVPDTDLRWKDLRLGDFVENPAKLFGDFPIKDRKKQWTYQFAVTVDDLEENIALVVRGEDLRSSTARQIVLSKALGRKHPPLFFHHPLLSEENGQKLSKRQHSVSLRAELEAGIAENELLGQVCYAVNAKKTPTALSLQDAISVIQNTYFSSIPQNTLMYDSIS